MEQFVKLVKIYNWFGLIAAAAPIILFLLVTGNVFLCSEHDCSGSLTYVFLSFLAIPWGVLGVILSGIAVWKRQLSWLWIPINLLIGGIYPLLIYIGILIYLD